ncbi:PAS domain S-box protein [Panacibacter ginsenosidivorans]|uniref:PAS domain S-box protein n=1 Tax=Panacibacter ginsenosidivorans TaxID=1813871 RepID=A0A5B8V4V4_9BACT|nr:PAS domain S-box protein [Panacibacter ginsenosidivorans]QEC66232.1 PAS domain S-box protein [Panacibacter ginsenosidivorans]
MQTIIQLPSWLKSSENNIVVLFDLKGNITDCNESLNEIIINHDQKNISAIFSAEEITELWKQLNRLHLNNNHTEFISTSNEGNNIQWEFSLFDQDHFIGIAQKQNSVTKRAESMINIHHLIDGFMNNSPASAWICDPDGKLVTMNKYYLNFTGLTRADIGKTLWDIYPKQLADLYFRNNTIVIESNKVLKTEEISIDRNGKSRNFLVYKFPLNTIDHKTLVGGWAVDITERKVAEQKIFAHDLKLKELAFLQSHEVRRPLANMLGLIELIKADTDKIENEYFKNILLYIQLSATELDNEIRRVIDKLQEE